MADKVRELAGLEMPDYQVDGEMQLEVGVTYTGSFKIQRNGQINVRPYQQGTKPNSLKKAVEGEQHAIFISKNLVRIVFTINKTDAEQIKARYKQIILDCYKDLCELEL